ncbi:MAG: ABC transporter ATP-binding protein, partial [Gammaproteobacteria bacterium]
ARGGAAPAASKESRRSAADRREQLRPLKQRIAELEKDMTRLQRELAQLDARLSDPALYTGESPGDAQTLLRTQASLRQQLASIEEEWLARSEELEAASG